jgi:hypothetical protein
LHFQLVAGGRGGAAFRFNNDVEFNQEEKTAPAQANTKMILNQQG